MDNKNTAKHRRVKSSHSCTQQSQWMSSYLAEDSALQLKTLIDPINNTTEKTADGFP